MTKDNIKYRWDLTQLFASDADPKINKDREKVIEVNYKFINKWKDRTDYLENPKVLKEALDEVEKIDDKYGSDGDEGYYFWLRLAQESNNEDLKAKFNKVVEFSQKIDNDSQFFGLRLAKISKEKQKEFLEAPELKEYKHYLETLFDEAKYLLTEPEEKILNLTGKVSHYNWVQMTSEILEKEEVKIIVDSKKNIKKLVSFSELASYLDNPDKKVRDYAAKEFNKIISKWIDIGVIEMNSIMENKKVLDELRKLERPDTIRHIADDVTSEMVDNLIEAVESRFYQAQDFYKLKAKLFGLKKLKYHERNLQYGKIQKKYPYPDATKLVHKVFSNLDKDFDEIFSKFLEEKRIDVFPRKGKTGGAFMAEGLKSQPIFILLNHTDKLQDVLTLAHEVGHGIHYTMAKKQNSINYGASTVTAEVASTFMEDFVLQEILKEADDELKLSLLMMRLNEEISTIHRQISCYKFEQDLHKEFREKGYLSKDLIGQLFSKNMKLYMGDYVEQTSGSENWWLAWSHIRSFFYVYTYASGLLISKGLQNLVKHNTKDIEKVKEFFESGVAYSPRDIFLKLGIDINSKQFWIMGLNEIDETLREVEELAGRLGRL